jgi:hypothetical protein
MTSPVPSHSIRGSSLCKSPAGDEAQGESSIDSLWMDVTDPARGKNAFLLPVVYFMYCIIQ